MLKHLNDKLKLMISTRDKCEELAMTMGFLDGGEIRPLKQALKKYSEDFENDSLRQNVDAEVDALIEIADQNRKDEGLLNKLPEEEEEEHVVDANDPMGWLSKYFDLSAHQNSDILNATTVDTSTKLKLGLILDA
mmetsp:Transcript_27346/g.41585  ORF Transcript_27346/g.41585 Transcript_27346/m.41585 type:complete len:135 (+) Transcript_27346:639-1043(+)